MSDTVIFLKGITFISICLVGIVLFAFNFSKGTEKGFAAGLAYMFIAIILGTVIARMVE